MAAPKASLSQDQEPEDEPDEKPASKRKQIKSTKSSILGCITIVAAILLCLVTHSFRTFQQDNKGCKMSYMYPSYYKLNGFDTEHTRFARKYSLYLYREQGIDTSVEPTGVPVLFVPGNAGSYKQIRPIAAEAASQFAESVKVNSDAMNCGKRNLDFFTVDFNEDFSAFHGQTLLEQAEYLNSAISYILSLYQDRRKSVSNQPIPDVTSVIVIGHSMGGIVARTMQIMPNYLPYSINTIVTMSTPHAIPPAPFDSKIQTIYTDINSFWRSSFSKASNRTNPLADVTLISIAGGGLDTIVSSDYTSVLTIVPPTNGFTVFTTTIPNVWTSVDHQAILWCDQFRKVVASCLLDIVDARRSSQTKPYVHRMERMRHHFLTGLESEEIGPKKNYRQIIPLQLGSDEILHMQSNQENFYQIGVAGAEARMDLIPIPSGTDDPRSESSFTLLTNAQNSRRDAHSYVDTYLCTVPSTEDSIEDLQRAKDIGIISNNDLTCRDASFDLVTLPSSQDLGTEGTDRRTYYLKYPLQELLGYQFIAIKHRLACPDDFVIGHYRDSHKSDLQSNITMTTLFLNGLQLTANSHQSFITKLRINSILSSMIAYKLDVHSSPCENALFAPITRQSISGTHESKFYVGSKQMDISLHGSSPYLTPSSGEGKGLTLEHWSDPACPGPLTISLKVDYYGSLGKLVMRYRIVLISFPLAVAMLVFERQLREYNNKGAFIHFRQALQLLVSDTLPTMLFIVSIASIYLPWLQHNRLHSPDDLIAAAASVQRLWLPSNSTTDVFLGLRDPFLWFLGPTFLFVSVGVVDMLSCLITFVTYTTAVCISWLMKIPNWVLNNGRTSSGRTPFSSTSVKRRLIVTGVLFFLVATVIPYQFAYIVACLVQLASTIRALRYQRDFRHDTRQVELSRNCANYNHSILTLMACVLPINIPILVVWIRNLSVQWLTPFSSHHNVLSVAPFILLVETLASGRMLQPVNRRGILSALLLITACYSFLYGVMYTYLLHQMLNVLAGCLVFLHIARPFVSINTKN